MDEEERRQLQRIEEKIDILNKMLREYLSISRDIAVPSKKMGAPVSIYLLKFPDSLRQTMLAMDSLKEATTGQVAEETGRSRSVESIHLNQLERMGYIEKFRKGRKVFFRIPLPPQEKKEAG